jgi:hypothetical protein
MVVIQADTSAEVERAALERIPIESYGRRLQAQFHVERDPLDGAVVGKWKIIKRAADTEVIRKTPVRSPADAGCADFRANREWLIIPTF